MEEKPKYKKGDWVRVKSEYEGAGIAMKVLGPPYYKEQWWVPVDDPREEDPTWNKETSLERLK